MQTAGIHKTAVRAHVSGMAFMWTGARSMLTAGINMADQNSDGKNSGSCSGDVEGP